MSSLGESLVEKDSIVLQLAGNTPTEAFGELIATLGEVVVHPAVFLAEVEAREKLQSTDTGRGFAFPHARTDAVTETALAIGRSSEGILLKENSQPVHLFFLFGIPPLEVTVYLESISRIARRLRQPGIYDALMKAQSTSEFSGILLNGGEI